MEFTVMSMVTLVGLLLVVAYLVKNNIASKKHATVSGTTTVNHYNSVDSSVFQAWENRMARFEKELDRTRRENQEKDAEINRQFREIAVWQDRAERFEIRCKHLEERLDRMDERLTQAHEQIESLSKRIGTLEQTIHGYDQTRNRLQLVKK